MSPEESILGKPRSIQMVEHIQKKEKKKGNWHTCPLSRRRRGKLSTSSALKTRSHFLISRVGFSVPQEKRGPQSERVRVGGLLEPGASGNFVSKDLLTKLQNPPTNNLSKIGNLMFHWDI